MNWQGVMENPFLRDLPFKIELNKFGQILMSPASNWHGKTQAKIVRLLGKARKNGEVLTECSIQTSEGVRVADVVWASDDFIDRNGYTTPYPEAPEICVEIVSPSNSREEMMHKVDIYLAKGAKEVWICSENGDAEIFAHRGKIDQSGLADVNFDELTS